MQRTYDYFQDLSRFFLKKLLSVPELSHDVVIRHLLIELKKHAYSDIFPLKFQVKIGDYIHLARLAGYDCNELNMIEKSVKPLHTLSDVGLLEHLNRIL